MAVKSPEYQIAIKAALEAGYKIMEIYEKENFQIEAKLDDSPLTIADKEANKIINSFLIPTHIPIISEENVEIPYDERKVWEQCWIVDPLDGTKEFIKKNGEFTVNIALIKKGKPIFGVIYAPALDLLYVGDVFKQKSWKITDVVFQDDFSQILNSAKEIKPADLSEDQVRVIGSRSHMNVETEKYVEDLRKKYKNVEMVAKGSSLKFCLVAEGAADIYPRFAPTMEWDTAAGQAICEAVGLRCVLKKTGESVSYNREDLLNDHFLVS